MEANKLYTFSFLKVYGVLMLYSKADICTSIFQADIKRADAHNVPALFLP